MQSKHPKVQSEKGTQKENGDTDYEVNGERCQMAPNTTSGQKLLSET